MSETPPETQIKDPDLPTSGGFSDHDLRTELESLRQSHHGLLSRSAAMEDSLNHLRQERDKAAIHNANLLGERNSLSERIRELESSIKEQEDGFAKRIEEEVNRIQSLSKEAEAYRKRIENLEAAREKSNGFLLKCLGSLRLAKDSLVRIIDSVNVEDNKNGSQEHGGLGVELELEEELRAVSVETMEVARLAGMAELKVDEYRELGKKEKRELQNSVVSLTEENRDINSLLRIALMEKEAMEKSLNRLKGNNEHKRVPLLQRVGFGFMMGGGSGGEHSSESSETKLDTSGTKSDSSECEEEVVTLVSSASLPSERVFLKC